MKLFNIFNIPENASLLLGLWADMIIHILPSFKGLMFLSYFQLLLLEWSEMLNPRFQNPELFGAWL